MQTMVPLYGFGGGGGTGATLTVTAPAGATVTASKDGKEKTTVVDASGVAVFKGLATGEWILTITDGEQTSAPQTVTITADYSTAITFFAATIHVTYPAGSTCTATDGTTTLTAPDTSGTWDCVVPNAGTWTITVVNKGLTDTVSISADGQTELVDLSKFYLFLDGNQYEDRTGGWTTVKDDGGVGGVGGTLNFNGNTMDLNGTSSTYGLIAACASFDGEILANFSAIYVKVESSTAGGCNVRVRSSLLSTNDIGKTPITGAGEYRLSLDGISSGQVMVSAYLGNCKISAVALE